MIKIILPFVDDDGEPMFTELTPEEALDLLFGLVEPGILTVASVVKLAASDIQKNSFNYPAAMHRLAINRPEMIHTRAGIAAYLRRGEDLPMYVVEALLAGCVFGGRDEIILGKQGGSDE